MMKIHGQLTVSISEGDEMKGVYFLSGIYGAGKSTLGEKLSEKLSIRCFHASDLISQINVEKYVATKNVNDIKNNQDILIEEVSNLRVKHEEFILIGHFAIFDKANCVKEIHKEVFRQLGLTAIILLEITTSKAIEHLYNRDFKKYVPEEIDALANAEHSLAQQVAKDNKIPIFIRQMDFLTDIDEIEKFIEVEVRN